VSASLDGESVIVSWRKVLYAVDFVILRKDEGFAGAGWQEVGVVPDDPATPTGRSFSYVDKTVAKDHTYIYGVRSRNLDKNGKLIESKTIESDPITIP
jgi:hypothetical protein